jgi:hypothetical protein
MVKTGCWKLRGMRKALEKERCPYAVETKMWYMYYYIIRKGSGGNIF